MSFPKKRYCVFGCAHLGAYMHNFPHPERRAEMFKKWLAIVGNKLKETDPMKIYKNKRICDYHITLDQKLASHRLMNTAVPSQYLDGVISTPSIAVELEHNYCIPRASQSASTITDSTCSGSSSKIDHNPNNKGIVLLSIALPEPSIVLNDCYRLLRIYYNVTIIY